MGNCGVDMKMNDCNNDSCFGTYKDVVESMYTVDVTESPHFVFVGDAS